MLGHLIMLTRSNHSARVSSSANNAKYSETNYRTSVTDYDT